MPHNPRQPITPYYSVNSAGRVGKRSVATLSLWGEEVYGIDGVFPISEPKSADKPRGVNGEIRSYSPCQALTEIGVIPVSPSCDGITTGRHFMLRLWYGDDGRHTAAARLEWKGSGDAIATVGYPLDLVTRSRLLNAVPLGPQRDDVRHILRRLDQATDILGAFE